MTEVERRIEACLKLMEGIPTEVFEGMTLDKFLSGDMKFSEVDIQEDSLKFEVSGRFFSAVADMFVNYFKDRPKGKDNYVELNFKHIVGEEISVLIQRRNGLTPAQKASMLEKQIAEMIKNES